MKKFMLLMSIGIISIGSSLAGDSESVYRFTSPVHTSAKPNVKSYIVDTQNRTHSLLCYESLDVYSLTIHDSKTENRHIRFRDLTEFKEIFEILDRASDESPVDLFISGDDQVRLEVNP